jgi:hypothetical protein
MKQIFNKIIALTTVFLLVLSMTVIGDETAAEFDIEPYIEAIQIVSKLNLFKTKSGWSEQLTRAEMTDSVVRALGFDDEILENDISESLFSDVPPSHWAAQSIMLATGYKVVSRSDMFYPENYVSYDEAVKMVVSALGYSLPAMSRGGYPSGYFAVASEKKLLVNVQSSGIFTKAMAAQLIFNSLETDLMTESQSSSGTSVTTEKNSNFLNGRLDVQRVTGQCTATYYSALYGSYANNEDEICIGGVNYKLGDTDAANYFGYYLTVYSKYDEKTNKNTILYYKINESDNKILTVASGDITSVAGFDDTDSITDKLNPYVEYTQNSGAKKVKLADGVKVIAGGIFTADLSNSLFSQSSGDLRLLDTNADSVYDIVFLQSYTTYILNAVNTVNYTVTDKSGNMLFLDPHDNKVAIYKNGGAADFGDLNEWDILCVSEADDGAGGKSIIVNVSDEKINGAVEEISIDSKGRTVYTIDEEWYAASPEYLSAVSAGFGGVKNLVPGDAGIFCLDIDGRVAAYYSTASTDAKYCYLIGIAQKNSLADESIKLKVLTLEGEIKTLSCDDSVLFSRGDGQGLNKTKREVILAELSGYDGLLMISTIMVESGKTPVKAKEPEKEPEEETAGEPENETDREETEEETTEEIEKINKIIMPSSGADYNEFSLFYKNPASKYKRAANFVDSAYRMTNNAPIFIVPTADSESVNDDNYMLRYLSNFNFWDDGAYNLELYDVKKSREIGAILIRQTVTSAENNNILDTLQCAVVSKVVLSIDNLGDPKTKIKLFFDGIEKSYYAISILEQKLAGLNPGDIIQFTEKDGIIDGYKLVYDMKTDTPYINNRLVPSKGIVEEVFFDTMIVSDKLYITRGGSFGHFYIYSKATNTVKAADVTDLMPNDTVIICYTDIWYMRGVLIIR